MRRILLLLLPVLCPVLLMAQANFSTALPISAGSEQTGSVSPAARYVYYKTLLPADGTVTVYLEGTHMGGANGSFSFYAYDKSGRQIGYDASVGSSAAKAGDLVRDTVRITSRAADSIYLLIYEGSSRTYNYKLKYAVLDQSANDPEPNGHFSNATPMEHDKSYAGHLGYEADNVTDRYDYYKTLLPADGTIKVYAEGVHTGGYAGSFSLYVYDKAGRQIGYKANAGSTSTIEGQTVRDSLSVYSRSVDSVYILLYQGSTRSYSYKVSYTVTDRNPNDPEPNNTFAQAGAFNMGETMQGQLGQEANNVTDRYDYYKTSLQADGTLVVYLEGVHTGGYDGSFSFYAYDKSQRQIGYLASVGNTTAKPGDIVRDTVRITSLQADTIYLLVFQGSSRSYSYKMSYEITDQSTNDPELNNTMAQAVPLKEQETVSGHLGYEADNITDRYDYYKTALPADGTITVYLEGMHTGRYAGSFSFYALDKSGRQIGYLANVGSNDTQYGGTVRDTVRITSRQADTVYLYLYQGSSRSYSYKMRYEMTDKSANDPEPNNVRADAIPINYNATVQGHLGYEADNVTDRYDYYKAVMPADGTVTVYLEGVHTGGYNGSFSFYALDKSGRQIGYLASAGSTSTKQGETVRDTVRITSRQADTIYLYVYQGSTRSYSYKMRYEVLDQSDNDREPNGEFVQALALDHHTTASGHLGYEADNVTDRYDYYKTLLPADGTVTVYLEGVHTGGANGSFSFYAYDKSRRQISYLAAVGSNTAKQGDIVRDTVLIPSRAADSIYLLVYQGSSRSYSYKLRYEMPGALTGDREPNNTFEEALSIKHSDTAKGLLGYNSAAGVDRYDYYKIAVPAKSSVKVYIEGVHTGGSDGSFGLWAYDRNRRQLTAKSAVGASVAVGGIVRDTIEVNCNSTDSLYISLYQGSSRSFTYSVRFEVYDNRPIAAFSYTRTGNEFGFMNESRNSNKLLWKFNNQTSTVTHPLQQLKPGFYDIQLIATNATCNFSDTAKKSLTISGIESFTPTESGAGGDLSMTIFGGGLDANTTVTLKNGSETLNTIEKYTNPKGNQLGILFDLHFAKPGEYDLEVKFPNEAAIVYTKAFKISAMIYPETWSEVTGPGIFRTGRTSNFNLVVGNRGNTVARGVIVAMIWPKSAQIEWLGKEYRPDPNGFASVTLDDGEVVKTPNSKLSWVYDINTTTPIDTFLMEPYNGYVRYFTVPVVPPGSTIELPFRMKSDSSAHHKFYTYTVKPNQFGSCETFNIQTVFTSPQAVELAINTLDIAVDELKVPPATKIPAQVAVKTLKVTQKHIDVGSKVAAHRFWAWYYGADDLTESEYSDYYKQGLEADEFAQQQLAEIAFDQAIDIGAGALIKKRSTDITEKLHASNQAALNHKTKFDELAVRPKKYQSKAQRKNRIRMKDEEARLWEEAFKSGQMSIDDLRKLEFLEAGLKGAKHLKNGVQEIELLIKYIEENCPEHKEQADKLRELLDKEEDITDPREKDSETRTSYDPNAIYGPNGFKAARYINSNDRQPFLITFENVDTAKADAQIVRIIDTIDRTKFDLSSFEFGSVTVGKHQFTVPKGRKQFMIEKSLLPHINMKVRINASLDTTTGIVFWLFTAIDPQTGDLPDFDGFLPPNTDAPSGEGSVSYTIAPKKGLADGTQLRSRASIVFDTNEPILTNTWQNTIDAVKPVSHISAKIYEDTLVVLEYSAYDAGSGVDYYNVYVSTDNGPWANVPGGNATKVMLQGEAGKSYRFYVEAQDKAGNRDKKNALGEAVVKLPEGAGRQPGSLTIYPVPTNGLVNMELLVEQEQQVTITVHSAAGQQMSVLYNGKANGLLKVSRQLAHLPNGLYFVTAKGSNGLKVTKKLVIAK